MRKPRPAEAGERLAESGDVAGAEPAGVHDRQDYVQRRAYPGGPKLDLPLAVGAEPRLADRADPVVAVVPPAFRVPALVAHPMEVLAVAAVENVCQPLLAGRSKASGYLVALYLAEADEVELPRRQRDLLPLRRTFEVYLPGLVAVAGAM